MNKLLRFKEEIRIMINKNNFDINDMSILYAEEMELYNIVEIEIEEMGTQISLLTNEILPYYSIEFVFNHKYYTENRLEL